MKLEVMYEVRSSRMCFFQNVGAFCVYHYHVNRKNPEMNWLCTCVDRVSMLRGGDTPPLCRLINTVHSVHVCELMRHWCGKVSDDASSGCGDLLQNSSISSNGNCSGMRYNRSAARSKKQVS